MFNSHKKKDVPKDNKSIDDKLQDLLNKESQRVGSKGFKDLAKENNLPQLISTILSDMENVKKGDDYFSHYYDTANQLFQINELARKASCKLFLIINTY